ncbi:MAG: hypothetical protein IJN96_02485 [Clostridia bacterium]|nr:hypothetical protein [Clostridia bacterium]
MKSNNKMWAILVHLSMSMWYEKYDELPFDDGMWDYIVEESAKVGVNTIVLDVGDGIEFGSHPEIACKGAWTRGRVRKEVARCKNLGIALIPKLNFATHHDIWLGPYHRMVSTPEYYRVCDDLIKEVYELFDHPEYIHIGMDEEDEKHVRKDELAVYRQGELFWHDIRFYVDSVADTGAKAWMWSCPLFDHPEEYKKHFEPDEVILSPWYYNALRKEHWTPVSSRQEYVTYYNEGDYAKMGIEYVEQDPFLVNFRNLALPLMEEGYLYVPCASVINKCDYNTSDLVEYFRDNAPDNQIVGYITAPWYKTMPEFKENFGQSFRFLKEAKEKFYE